MRRTINAAAILSASFTLVEDAYRDSRSRLLHIGASYYDALDQNNGSLTPFWGGKMHEIEAIGITAPYMSPTGWE